MPLEPETDEQIHTLDDFSTGVQDKTSRFLKRKSDLDDGLNIDYSKKVGAVSKILGNSQKGNNLTTTTSTSTSTSTTTTSTSTSTTTSTSTSTTTTG